MMKMKIYCLLGLLVVGSVRADTGATSKYYVDSELAQKEALIPAKSVDTLLTYPKTGGDSVERQIKSTLDNSTTDTSVVTAGAANDKIETRQDKVLNLPSANVLTYSDTDGTIISKQIYSASNTLGDGLVTAQTLNDAVVAAVNNELTEVQGIGWQINSKPQSLPVATFRSITGKDVPFGKSSTYTITYDTGSTGLGIINGKTKLGIDRNVGCSTWRPTVSHKGYIMDTYVNDDNYGIYCYCPMVASSLGGNGVAKWVYLGEVPLGTNSNGQPDKCLCPSSCASEIKNNPEFRRIVFSGI